MTSNARKLTSTSLRPAHIINISKTASNPPSAPPIFLPPAPPLNPITKPSVSVDAGVEEVLGKNDKTNDNIANYRTIVCSDSISLVRVRVPLVPPRCSNEWITKGKKLPNAPFKKIWPVKNSPDQLPSLFDLYQGEDVKPTHKKSPLITSIEEILKEPARKINPPPFSLQCGRKVSYKGLGSVKKSRHVHCQGYIITHLFSLHLRIGIQGS